MECKSVDSGLIPDQRARRTSGDHELTAFRNDELVPMDGYFYASLENVESLRLRSSAHDPVLLIDIHLRKRCHESS